MPADPVGNATPNTADRSTFPGDWADLPLQRRCYIGKTGIFGTADFCKVRRRIHENFETVCNSGAQARIRAVNNSIVASRAEIDAILDLQTARWSNNAGIRDIRPIGVNFVPDARTTVRLCRDCAVIEN
jgi:hypothetical protein